MRTNDMLRNLKQRTRVRTRALEMRDKLRERREERQDQVLRGRYARWREAPLRERTVLYESFAGNGALCNPEAIFRYLLGAPDMADLHHVWALDDLEKHPELREEFADDHRVSFVQVGAPEYFEALATSGYLFNNATFGSDFVKRPGQVYVNTWHGVPLKRMGYHLEDGGLGSRNILRNFLAADYLLSANAFMTDTMYRDAFRLEGLYAGRIIEEGQPRTDRQIATEMDRAAVEGELGRAGIDLRGRTVVLYAPTWKGGSFQQPVVNTREVLAAVEELQTLLDPETYVVLLKVHQVVYDAMSASGLGHGVLVPNRIPTNCVLGVTDILVTDYSSICLDFVVSRRPVVHLVPDLEEYSTGRGLYLDEEQLPGPLCATPGEVAAHVRSIEGAECARSAAAAEKFAPRDDGGVSRRVVDVVFRGGNDAAHHAVRDCRGDKETMLVYLGSLAPMGITASALNLLRNLDHDRFDVSAFFPNPRGIERVRNAQSIDSRVRVLPRFGDYPAGPRDVARELRLMSTGLPDRPDEAHRRFWDDEWRRMFGMSTFDYALDLSGYGSFAPFLFSAAGNAEKSLWLHSDLKAESQRETAGSKHLEQRLKAVFTTFGTFDHLVSVSAELDQVNSTKLRDYAPPEKFTHASNTIDHERVLTMAGFDEHGQKLPGKPTTVDVSNLASALSTLLQHFDARSIAREARARAKMSFVPRRDDNHVTFVSVGRISPEKNHGRLIRAFAQVHAHHPHTRLVILGDGPLMPEVSNLVASHGLQEVISLAGRVDNPFAIMAECDCLVLSSNYEGQPMVVLEARTLDLSVISTRFPSVVGSLPEGAGLIVDQSDAALADGMQRLLAGEVPRKRLDWDAYNGAAMSQFYRAIGATPSSPPVEQAVDHSS